MSTFMFPVLLFIMLFNKQESTVIRHIDLDPHKRIKASGLEYVVHKYLNPLRRLQAELPNHAIELQIEILDQVSTSSQPTPVPVPQRRVIRVLNRHPKKIARANGAATPALLKQGPDEPETATAAAGDDASTTTPAGETTTATTAGGDGQKPVYMEDLQKALTDLEKKLEQKQADKDGSPCGGGQSQSSQNIKSIDDILEILKKAVHIEKHIPKPSDENLEWIQIKIPKA